MLSRSRSWREGFTRYGQSRRARQEHLDTVPQPIDPPLHRVLSVVAVQRYYTALKALAQPELLRNCDVSHLAVVRRFLPDRPIARKQAFKAPPGTSAGGWCL